MAFHSQLPPQYLSHHSNSLQHPFGSASLASNAPGSSNAPSSFNELSLPNENGAFLPADYPTNAIQSYEQTQVSGNLRVIMNQVAQLETRMEGRLQEIRLRAESTESALRKLEPAHARPLATDKASEARMDRIESDVKRLQASLDSVLSLQQRFESFDESAAERFDDDYDTIRVIIQVVMRIAAHSLHATELEQLQDYCKQVGSGQQAV